MLALQRRSRLSGLSAALPPRLLHSPSLPRLLCQRRRQRGLVVERCCDRSFELAPPEALAARRRLRHARRRRRERPERERAVPEDLREGPHERRRRPVQWEGLA